jgi:hypothetical protein
VQACRERARARARADALNRELHENAVFTCEHAVTVRNAGPLFTNSAPRLQRWSTSSRYRAGSRKPWASQNRNAVSATSSPSDATNVPTFQQNASGARVRVLWL